MYNKSFGEPPHFNKIILTAVLIAVTLALSIIIPPIPIPGTHGNFNLCDTGILTSALLLGPKVGGSVGALSGFLLDILTGYSNYSIFSFIVHGLEGLIAGKISRRRDNKYTNVAAVIVGSVVMVTGYFFSDSLLYTIYAGYLGILFNLIQSLVGGAIALFVFPFLKKRIH